MRPTCPACCKSCPRRNDACRTRFAHACRARVQEAVSWRDFMHSIAEAQEIVLRHAQPLVPTRVPLDATAVDLILAEDIASDLDLPPFDKALMDGYAVRAADLANGRATLTVIEEIMAGQVPTR